MPYFGKGRGGWMTEEMIELWQCLEEILDTSNRLGGMAITD